MSTDDDSEREAREQRAKDIRLARDKRNARISQPSSADPGAGAASDDAPAPVPTDPAEANYVEFIDRKMRTRK